MSAGSIVAGEAFVEIGGDNKPLGGALSKATSMLDNFASQAARLGAVMAAGGAAILAPLHQAITKSSAYEETLNKFNVIFEDQAVAVRKWGETHAAAINRSKIEYIDMLGTAQSLFRGMGLGTDEASEMSKKMVALASDMGSFWDMADTEAWTRLASGIVGETEAVRRWGIDLGEANMKQQALNAGIKKNYSELTQAEKIQLRVNIIMKATTKMQGDASNTAGSYANSLRGVWAQAENLAVAVGDHLLPAATRWLNAAMNGIKAATKWAEKNAILIKAIAGVGIALSAAGASLLGLAAGAAIISTLLSPLSLVVMQVALVAAAVLTVIDALGLADLGFKSFLSNMRVGNITIQTWFQTTWANILGSFLGVRDSIVTGWESLVVSFQMVGSLILSGVMILAKGISSGFWEAIKGVSSSVSWLVEKIQIAVAKAQWLSGSISYGEMDRKTTEAKSQRRDIMRQAEEPGKKSDRYYSDLLKAEAERRDKLIANFDKSKINRAKKTADELKKIYNKNVSLMLADLESIDAKGLKDKMTGISGKAAGLLGGAGKDGEPKTGAVGSFFSLQGAQMIGGLPEMAKQTGLQKKMVKSLSNIEEKSGDNRWT